MRGRECFVFLELFDLPHRLKTVHVEHVSSPHRRLDQDVIDHGTGQDANRSTSSIVHENG